MISRQRQSVMNRKNCRDKIDWLIGHRVLWDKKYPDYIGIISKMREDKLYSVHSGQTDILASMFKYIEYIREFKL